MADGKLSSSKTLIILEAKIGFIFTRNYGERFKRVFAVFMYFCM